jgi:transcription-repair coupling factor (superfamily II helicase)
VRLAGLVAALATDATVLQAVEYARMRISTLDLSAPAAARAFVIATLAAESARPMLVVTPTVRAAEALLADLAAVYGGDASGKPGEPAAEVAYYPSWETLPHERFSPRSDTVGQRLRVLRRLAGRDLLDAPQIIVAPVRALLQPQAAGLQELLPVTLRVGADYELAQLAADLVAAAYNRVDLVERRGEFAVRGGIVDLFPPDESHPVRIDFFGDTIEEIRHFGVADQLSLEDTLDELTAAPCRELLITAEVRARAAALIDDHPALSDMLERIAQGQAVEGMEALLPALVPKMELFIDKLPPDALVVVIDPELTTSRASELVRTSQEFLHAGWVAAAAGGKTPIDLKASAYWEYKDVRARALAAGMSWWGLSTFMTDAVAFDAAVAQANTAVTHTISGDHLTGVTETGVSTALALPIRPLPTFRGDADGAIQAMRADVLHGWSVVVAVTGKGLAKRLAELLSAVNVSASAAAEFTTLPHSGMVTIVSAPLTAGWRMPELKLALYTSADISGQTNERQQRTKLASKRRNQVVPLELNPGDIVVHEYQGIGRYIAMAHRSVGGAEREYLVIEYAPRKRGQPGDQLYVPMDQLDLVTRYIGGESPALDRMGGADWKARKSRARKAVREIAAELIKLYAARQATKGHAFSSDTPWQREMEDAFAYTETPDQLTAINDVKADMELIVPMDRLVSGDVGYGKTEIAVRAAFKAVMDSKQVVVLVPTTLLVRQHFETFTARYAGFPVRVRPLSRFQNDTEVQATLAGLADGTIDVVIGTHRLLSGDVKFKDLGLVIVDEEQRFGVEHKESLKRLRVNVDVLSMSATPIPRTLEMAVTGIREMSTIATPPEERHPVLTFVGNYDAGQVSAAIRRELAREGQVFYVHNRVQSINKVAARLRELVPEARVIVGHGQLGERQLESLMQDFYDRKADVLVSTTIIESGLDVASANTLIVENADRFGLSQLHQLRGRVGRSRERGYAYFLYPPLKELHEAAHDRLSALATNTDLGAGMAIAMRDLEIRGAGNLLGAEQSGHIGDVGFDLYLRLVGEAVADYRGGADEHAAEEIPMRIDLPVDAHLSVAYIESERLRLEMYKRIAETRSMSDLRALGTELVDRYGEPPAETARLLAVAAFRLTCREIGLREVVAQGEFLRLSPVTAVGATSQFGAGEGVQLPQSRVMRLNRVYPGSLIKPGQILVRRPRTVWAVSATKTEFDWLQWSSDVIKALFG